MRSGPEREMLRAKGQFWTPDWVADAMVRYALHRNPTDHLFDPAVGAGAFFQAAKIIAKETGATLKLLGTELDPAALQQARHGGLTNVDLAHVQLGDFVLHPPRGPFKAIVANPPYIRHHRLSASTKAQLKAFTTQLLGKAIDGRAGLHVYFLLRALQSLAATGRLAFIMPADTCEGVFAPTLWRWITRRYALEAVVTFAPEASPFPGVDTNAVIFMIKHVPARDRFLWARCHITSTESLNRWVRSGFVTEPDETLEVFQRTISEGLATGFSRPPVSGNPTGPRLGDFAKVLRGIATGANEFFLLTTERANALKIPRDFLRLAVARTRDVKDDAIDSEWLKSIRRTGRPTWLLSLDGRPMHQFPMAVRAYLQQGERAGLHKHALLSTRNPWYKMEIRTAPPILFAYLGRRSSRFIRNYAGVVPLTGFLCIYPRQGDPGFIVRLWAALRHPTTVANLALVGKSYGGGAIKVEPRALEQLPLPAAIVSSVGLQIPRQRQLEFSYPVTREVAAHVFDRPRRPVYKASNRLVAVRKDRARLAVAAHR